jgi:hypothetical protein
MRQHHDLGGLDIAQMPILFPVMHEMFPLSFISHSASVSSSLPPSILPQPKLNSLTSLSEQSISGSRFGNSLGGSNFGVAKGYATTGEVLSSYLRRGSLTLQHVDRPRRRCSHIDFRGGSIAEQKLQEPDGLRLPRRRTRNETEARHTRVRPDRPLISILLACLSL